MIQFTDGKALYISAVCKADIVSEHTVDDDTL